MGKHKKTFTNFNSFITELRAELAGEVQRRINA